MRDAKCSLASSRWALLTPVTRARLGCGWRLSGERCGGGDAIGGEIAPHPPTHVSLDTARSDGHKTSEMEKRGGGLDCRESGWESRLPNRGLTATYRSPAEAGQRDAAASALRRRPGMTGRFQTEDFICPGEERGNAASLGRTVVAWPQTGLQQSIVAAELSRTEGGLGTCGYERHVAHRPAPTAGS